jgi:nicotinic acid phosphoribosyltransferase
MSRLVGTASGRHVHGQLCYLQGTASPLLGSRLHDFGFRGCTCVEQSIIGGCAHLLNFDGTDTMAAAYYAQVSSYKPAMPVV